MREAAKVARMSRRRSVSSQVVLACAFVLTSLVTLLHAPSAHAQQGVPQNGFPSWEERMVQVYANRARADPTGEMKACSASTVRPPLVWSYNLNRAARFHARNLQAAIAQGGSDYFEHDSSCHLVPNLASIYLPNGMCDGELSCACQNGTLLGPGEGTPTFTRIGLFGTPGSGENIAYGYGSPWHVHTGWMNSQGHCSNLLSNHGAIGVGFFATQAFWVQNFGGSGTPSGSVIAGGHFPRIPGTGNLPIEFRVNYYNTAGGPNGARVNIDGECHTMSLERGSQTNGTWRYDHTFNGPACRRYVFVFEDPQGNVAYLPETGSYGVWTGPNSGVCEDWEPGTPNGCGPLDRVPTIATAASANPSPVTGDSTQLSVLGADDGGEAALVYAWTAQGPAPVSFSPNGTNAAKQTVATFSRAGTYVLTAGIRDAANQTTPANVTVVVAQTPTGVTISPATAAVAVNTTRQFTANALDQFGQTVAPPPSFAWTVAGGGTISQTGLFAAGDTSGGPFTITATANGVSGSAQVIVGAGTPPLVTQAASVNPNPVTGKTATVTVLATDDGGDEVLTYAWTATGPAQVAFSPNGSNAARESTATFTRAGTYQLTATVQDPFGLSAQSSVDVVVEQRAGEVKVTPLQATVKPNGTAQFIARARDQFGAPMVPQPAFNWAVSAGGSIDAEGKFTAGATSGGPHTVTANSGGFGATAQVVVTQQEPPALVVALASPTNGAKLLGNVKLSAQVNDAPRVALVRFTVDDVEIGEAQLAPYELTWDTRTHPDGARRLRAGVLDAAGNTTWSQEITVELTNNAPDTTKPTVTILSPQPGPLSGMITVLADATDDRGVTQVTFSVDGAPFASLVEPPWQAEFDASAFSGGNHVLAVTALDAAGNEGRAELGFGGGGGCGCGAGGAGWLLPFGLFALVGTLRRRRR